MNATMKIAAHLAFSLTLLQGALSSAQETAPDTTAIQAQITANGRAVGRAINTMDFAALEKVWSPAMVVNSPGNNILTRDQVFAAMREDKLKYSSSRAIRETFFVVRDVAVEMGHDDIVMSNGPMAGKPLTRRFTNVWQKNGDQWLQIARQATYVGVDGGAVYGHPDPTLSAASTPTQGAVSAGTPEDTKAIEELVHLTCAQTPATTGNLPAGDEQAIRQRFADLDMAWNRHDANQITNPQTAVTDADYINVNGGWVRGREPFVAVMSKLQAGPFHDVQRHTIVEKIRFIRPDVAVVITTNIDRQGDGRSSESRGTYVLSKEGGRWLLNSFQNTQIAGPPGQPIAPQSPLVRHTKGR